MKNACDLSIIIVSYNTKELLSVCLSHLVKAAKKWEVIVVDNASVDGTQKMVQEKFPWIHLIANEKNSGFAAANNMGLGRSRGRYLLLLNSDTEASIDAIEKVLTFLDTHPDVGAATCQLMLPSGEVDPACHRGFPTPWGALTYFVGLEKLFPGSRLFGQYHLGFRSMDVPHEIDSPSGAFFMVRREVYAAVGGLDEDYFMYGEDLDWSYRIRSAGWKIFYIPGIQVLHRKKQSGRASDDKATRKVSQRHFYETMLLFYTKHYAHRYSPLTTFFVRLVLLIRLRFL